MSDDKVVNILKQQQKSLDETVHGLAKETANIKDIGLNNQNGISSLKEDTTVIKARVTVLEYKTDEVKEQLNRIELLIRQLHPVN